MNEKLPYEQQLQQQWTDIPLPDENMAWDDMARRLEEDDDKPVVFWWRPGCGLPALLLVLVGLGWWIVRPEKQFFKKGHDTVQQITTTKEQDRSGNNKQGNTPTKKNNNTNNPAPAGNEVTPTDEEAPVAAPTAEAKKTEEAKEPGQETQVKEKDKKGNPPEPVHQQKNGKREKTSRLVSSDNAPVYVTATKKAGNKKGKGSKTGTGKTTEQPVKTTGSSAIDQTKPNNTNTSDTTDKQDTTSKQDTTNKQDTVVEEPVKKDSVKKSRPPSTAKQEPPAADSGKKNNLFFSAGLSLQQQIPLAGQKPTPYSSTGRKGSLADYIPSVYMRLNKKEKWFLQAEFRYGAPQYSKEFTYHQASIPDTGSNPQFVTNSSARLKKTFYHQLPITFNYFVKPNWSVGGGVIWNKFYAALSDQETIKHDLNTQTDVVVFKGLVSVKDDTSGTFASSYLQAVIESQYKWKRFSFGARYAFGLQPYIRFTLPGQGTREERNSNLQLFLRFELIRPKQD